jgi:hypothetical protein
MDFEVVSKTALKNVVPEKIPDVGVLRDHAYLAAWGSTTCKYNGVHVVDISNVSAPEEVAFIASKEGSYPGEGIQAIPISTKHFNGDILVSHNEKCVNKDHSGFGGLNLYDVTDPAHPTPLAEGMGDTTANGQGKKAANEIHSVFAWDAGDRAYVVMTDNEEGTDVDIMDITNPRKPFLAAEYDLDETFPQILQDGPSNLVEIFLHDMIVKEIGGKQVMLLSYWDAGYVKIDITDVKAPKYLGDTDFANPDPELWSRRDWPRSPRATPTRPSSPSTTSTSSVPPRTSDPTPPKASPTTTPPCSRRPRETTPRTSPVVRRSAVTRCTSARRATPTRLFPLPRRRRAAARSPSSPEASAPSRRSWRTSTASATRSRSS